MKAQTDTKLRVLLNVVSEQIAASVPFKAIVSICPSDDPKLERVRFDATMPAHGHGMNYDVELRKTAIGCYKTGPLLFHMPGLWRIELAVRTSSQTVRFFHEVTVE